jgi:hypothetical protein
MAISAAHPNFLPNSTVGSGTALDLLNELASPLYCVEVISLFPDLPLLFNTLLKSSASVL